MYEPTKNNSVSKQRGFYNVQTSLNLSEFKNSLLILIWPPFNTRMADRALNNFVGNYVIHYGDATCTGDAAFFKALETNWNLTKIFDPIGTLIDENGNYNDKIYMYTRKIKDEIKTNNIVNDTLATVNNKAVIVEDLLTTVDSYKIENNIISV